jgi:hypothetical protein
MSHSPVATHTLRDPTVLSRFEMLLKTQDITIHLKWHKKLYYTVYCNVWNTKHKCNACPHDHASSCVTPDSRTLYVYGLYDPVMCGECLILTAEALCNAVQ